MSIYLYLLAALSLSHSPYAPMTLILHSSTALQEGEKKV